MASVVSAAGSAVGGIEAELVRVPPGACSGPLRSGLGSNLLVVVEGRGSALVGDVWLAVGPGDRVTVDEEGPIGLRADDSGPLIAVVLGLGPVAALAA